METGTRQDKLCTGYSLWIANYGYTFYHTHHLKYPDNQNVASHKEKTEESQVCTIKISRFNCIIIGITIK